MSVYQKKCARCRTGNKSCKRCRWIAIAPPSMTRKSLGTYRTQGEALAAERKALELRDRGINVPSEKISVRQLVERYLLHRIAVEKHGLKWTEECRRSMRLYIEPHIGSVPVMKLHASHLAAMNGALLKQGRVEGCSISAKTLSNAFGLLSAALNWATDMGLVAENVAKRKAARPPQPGRANVCALTNVQVERRMDAAKGTRWANFQQLGLNIAARRGELCGLS